MARVSGSAKQQATSTASLVGDSPGVIITPGVGPIRFAFGVSFPTNDGNANADSRSMQLLIHALHGVRCIIVDLVLMQFNGGTEFMGKLSGPDKTYGEILSQSLRLRADALQLIASKCIFFACGEAAKRFKQYGAQYTICHPQCAWGSSGPLNDWRALCEYEELIMFATGGGIDDEMAASDRLNNARKHALSRTQAEASTACRSVEDEMQVILLFRLYHSPKRLMDVEKSLRTAGKHEEADELKKEKKEKKAAEERKKKEESLRPVAALVTKYTGESADADTQAHVDELLAERHTEKDLTLIADIEAWLSHQVKTHGGRDKAAAWVNGWPKLGELIRVKYSSNGPLMQYRYNLEDCTATIKENCGRRLRCVLTAVEWGADMRMTA
jgi:hypothetical protein